jgi:hypothetical protein
MIAGATGECIGSTERRSTIFFNLLVTRKVLHPVPWTPISLNVGVFFSTMAPAYYDTFKNMLREASDHFPEDEE